MSYTAKNQLFFSMTATAQTGRYDYNWHWYDGSGMRVISHVQQDTGWAPDTMAYFATGTNYYVYDGANVAMVLTRTDLSDTTWYVKQRFVSGGVDAQLGGLFEGERLMFVADAQGSTRAAFKSNGDLEENAQYWNRDPFGGLLGASGTGGSTNTETGFGGASTPNSTGGFTYLRNRWYDAQTGRFLTQDPIGLGGGVNLYAYAGNSPTEFSDPFGLWPPHTHDLLIERALAGHASNRSIAMVAAGSRHADGWRNQANDRDYVHSMRGPFQTPQQATAERNHYFATTLTAAREAELAGDHDEAMNLLGQAVHPMMDATSPYHTDSNGNPQVWDLSDPVGAYHHGVNESKSSPTNAEAAEAERRVKTAYDYVVKK